MFLNAPVIDADARKVENPLVLPEYLDAAARRRVRVVGDAAGRAFWVVDDRSADGGLEARRLGGDRSPFAAGAARFGAIFPRLRLADMDRAGIDVQVLVPTFGLGFSSLRDVELATALCRAYNDQVAAECAQAPARLVPVGVVPAQDVAAATEEMRRCVVDLGMPAIVLPPHVAILHPAASAPAASAGPEASAAFLQLGASRSIGDPAFAPLFETAEFLDVALVVHAEAGAGATVAADPANPADPADRLAAAMMRPRQHAQEALLQLIVRGVLERHPRLRFAFFGAGCGWIPDFVHELGRQWQRHGDVGGPSLLRSPGFMVETLRERRGRGLLAGGRALRSLRAQLTTGANDGLPAGASPVPAERNPEEYFARGQVFVSFVADDPGPAHLRAAFGPVGERLACWSSMYGAWNARVEGAVERMRSDPQLPADFVARLLTTNALRFYGERLRRRLAPDFPPGEALRKPVG